MKPEDLKELAKKRFGKFANEYLISLDHSNGYDLDRLVELANPMPDWIVLDVATGPGHTALKFAPIVNKVAAVDMTAEMINAAKSNAESCNVHNIEFVLGERSTSLFPMGSSTL
jgi:ubiquinone/menaquinone biosynthesis C-methylase UbiE